jgi:hypothetical protein
MRNSLEPQVEAYKKIVILEDESEAQLLKSILIEREIPHLIRSYHDTAFDGLFQSQKGWGCISAPEIYEQKILEIVTDLRKPLIDPE